jgi:hypothetical protein
MIQADYDDFVDIMQVVSEQYGKKPSDSLVALYWIGLKNYDWPAVRDAIGRHLGNTENGQFMPKIADIVKMMEGSAHDAAMAAWSKVDKTVRVIGTNDTVVFDDPLIHRVLHDMGGWLMLESKTDHEWPFVAKEFENRYRGLKAAGREVEYPAKLLGRFEATNTEQNRKIAPAVLIGNKGAAMLVLENGAKGSALLEFSSVNTVPEVLRISK